MADGLVQQDAGPAWTEYDRHFARRRRHRFEIDQGLSQRFIDLRLPGLRCDIGGIAGSPAGSLSAGFHPVAIGNHHRNIEPHQWPDVRQPVAVGPQDLDHLPFARDGGRDLFDPRILGTGIGIDFLKQRDLGLEAHLSQRIDFGIKRLIGGGRRCGGNAAMARMHGLDRFRGALDRRFAQLRRMGVAHRFVGDRAQPESLCRIERGIAQPTVIEGKAFRLAVFEKQLTVIGAGQRVPDDAGDSVAVHTRALEKQCIALC